jgi:hypothetical protein
MGDSLICESMDPNVSERILNGLMCGKEAWRGGEVGEGRGRDERGREKGGRGAEGGRSERLKGEKERGMLVTIRLSSLLAQILSLQGVNRHMRSERIGEGEGKIDAQNAIGERMAVEKKSIETWSEVQKKC